MVAGCATKAIKFIFFAINLLFFLAGAALVAAAIWLRLDTTFQKTFTEAITKSGVTIPPPEGMYIALYVIIGIGAIMLITGFFGCCGAWCESVCMLGLFFSVVLTLFCVQIAGGAYVYFKQDDIKGELSNWYKTNVLPLSVGPDAKKEVTDQLNSIHQAYNCCGADGCMDYRTLTPNGEAPDSCRCKEDPQRAGCTAKLAEDIRSQWKWALLGLCVVLFIELMAMIFACCLCTGIRQGAYDYYY